MTTDTPWWRRAVCYQIYPRSFADSNGDGIGDIGGIRARLDHLVDLGIDAVWISPWYPSPLHDGGYDVADYRSIDPRIGDLAGAEAFIAEAAAVGIRVIVDIVPNHTSSEHPWFVEALGGECGSPARDRYIFRRGRGEDGELPPTNWRSVFGGPAWSAVGEGEWYLHLFDATQPDLNWESAEVRAEFDDIFRFWIHRGVSGFRIDVAHSLMKDPAFPDVDEAADVLSSTPSPGPHAHWDRDEVHDIIRRWRKILDAADRDVMMVAEAWVAPERLPLYLRPDEYHQSFDFDLMTCAWHAADLRQVIDRAHTSAHRVGSASTWALSNHDVVRHATRYGLPPDQDWRRWLLDGPHDVLDVELGIRRARAAALLLLALPGSAYLYQGDELGLPEVWDLPEDVLQDPAFVNSGRTIKGRDGCRVPMPWSRTGSSFGFGSNGSWLPQPAWFGELSAEAQRDDPTSTLELYRRAIALRRSWLTGDETLVWLELGDDVVAFTRGSGLVSVTNLGPVSVALPDGEVVIASEPVIDGLLAADSSAWLAPRRHRVTRATALPPEQPQGIAALDE